MGICKSRTISDFTFQSVKLLVRKFRGLSLQDFLGKRARELGWPVNAMVNMMRLINCRNFALPLHPNSREGAMARRSNAKRMVVDLAKDPDRDPARA